MKNTSNTWNQVKRSTESRLIHNYWQYPGGTRKWLFTARNSSCGKVMFLQACVHRILSGGGGVYPTMQWVGGVHPPGRTTKAGTT